MRRVDTTLPASRLRVRCPALVLAVGLFVSCTGFERLGKASDAAVAEAPAATVSLSSIERPDQITGEVADWLHRSSFERHSPEETLRSLLMGLRSAHGLDLKYRSGFTGTAEEVFSSRRFNCLSFSYLLVGLGRELGLPVYYMRAGDVYRYQKEGDLVIGTTHATVGFGSGPNRWVLEFGVGPLVDYRLATRISDEEAIALYYANRGAEQMQDGDVRGGLKWLETAVGLAPGLADAWLNYGVALRRSGDLDGAERSYRLAIALAPDFASPYHNLALLLRLRGRNDAATEMFELLDERKTRNPFVYLDLGDLSLDQGELDQAERFYRRAERLAKDSGEIQAALGFLKLRQADNKAARRWLRKAQRNAPDNVRVMDLAAELKLAADLEP